ncbi:MAG: hypothetical protein HUJ25_16705 [Crocinitomicaceae bacterium]|nr:hypothetical protein [Crocinitomicaceae bacterium]
MKALITFSLLFVLSASFAQDTQEHVLTIYLTDSLSGDASDVEIAYVIEQGSRDYMTVQPSAQGVFAIQLAQGQYTINFKHVDGRRESIEVNLTGDVTKNVVFAPATNN